MITSNQDRNISKQSLYEFIRQNRDAFSESNPLNDERADIQEAQLLCTEITTSLGDLSKLWTEMGIFGPKRADRRREWVSNHRDVDRIILTKEKECLDWAKKQEKKLKENVDSLTRELKLEAWHSPPGSLISTIEKLLDRQEELISLRASRLTRWDQMMSEYRSTSRSLGREIEFIGPNSTVPSEQDIDRLEKKLCELRSNNLNTKSVPKHRDNPGRVEEDYDEEEFGREVHACEKIRQLEDDLRICLERLRRKEAELEAAKKIISLFRTH